MQDSRLIPNLPQKLELARAYVARGWHVMPVHQPKFEPLRCSCGKDCKKIGKHPIQREWTERASVDMAEVEKWFRQWPNANVGLLTGIKSGVFVVDVDPRNGGDETLAGLIDAYGELPETPHILTGGGGHAYVFSHPNVKVTSDSEGKLLGAGIDIRGHNAMQVLPGSMHQSGRTYEWEASTDFEMPVSQAPGWMLEMLRGAGCDIRVTSGECHTLARAGGSETEITPTPQWYRYGRHRSVQNTEDGVGSVSVSVSVPSPEGGCVSDSVSVSVSVSVDDPAIEQAIVSTQPRIRGTRNACLFKFARALRGTHLDAAPLPEVKPIVREWHRRALPVISTKDFDSTWADFCGAWERVKVPQSADPVFVALERADALELPAKYRDEYDSPPVRRMILLCAVLQQSAADVSGEFYLACRKAGAALEIDFKVASKILRMLRMDGVLLVTKENTERTAFRFKYLGPTPQALTSRAVTKPPGAGGVCDGKPPQTESVNPPKLSHRPAPGIAGHINGNGKRAENARPMPHRPGEGQSQEVQGQPEQPIKVVPKDGSKLNSPPPAMPAADEPFDFDQLKPEAAAFFKRLSPEQLAEVETKHDARWTIQRRLLPRGLYLEGIYEAVHHNLIPGYTPPPAAEPGPPLATPNAPGATDGGPATALAGTHERQAVKVAGANRKGAREVSPAPGSSRPA